MTPPRLLPPSTLAELIRKELIEQSRCQPSSRPTTAKEKRAWKAYCEVMGKDATLSLVAPSMAEVASRVARRLVEIADASKGAKP